MFQTSELWHSQQLLLQHKLIDAPVKLTEFFGWEMLQSIPVQNSGQLQFGNFTKHHFSYQKRLFFLFHQFEWIRNGWNQALNAQKARVTSAPVRDAPVSLDFFQAMEFVVRYSYR